MVGPLKNAVQMEPSRRVDDIVEALLTAVLSGTYPPGSVLPPEREFASQLGVSRTSLRQAITRLEQLGVVAAHQGRGTVVLDIADTTEPSLIKRIAHQHGAELVGELFEVRQAMGALAGRLAAQRATPADLRALNDALARAERAEGAAELQRVELSYFVHLVDAAHNRPLRTMLRWVEQAYGSSAETFTAAFEMRDDVLAGLRAIVGAVSNGDPDGASEAVERYAEHSARHMLDALGRNNEGLG